MSTADAVQRAAAAVLLAGGVTPAWAATGTPLETASSARVAILGASALCLVLLLAGAFWVHRRRGQGAETPTLTLPPAERPAPPPALEAALAQITSDEVVRGRERVEAPPVEPTHHICAAFQEWLANFAEHTDLWMSFDQLLRELLSQHLGVTRVRCYHVNTGADALQPLSQASKSGEAPLLPHSREGVLGHVATTGREFVAADPQQGPLVDNLAASTDDHWAWVWPIRDRRATIGVVAVGPVPDPAALAPPLRHPIAQLISLAWQHVACLDRLRVVQRTDQASGVLTRGEFFARAEDALADSYRVNEPVVVAVMALEGLRRLDDARRWRERDQLIERVGQLITRRVRSDDLVGRFADDRFLVLLRRLDSGLGRLIAEKMLVSTTECLQELKLDADGVRARAGLAGSGFTQPPLGRLLESAFEAVDWARKKGQLIGSDLDKSREDA